MKHITLLSKAAEEEWVEQFPYGITMGTDPGRPILVLKDSTQTEVLPVWLNPLDAGLALADLSRDTASPHAVITRLMEALQMKVEECRFVEIVGHHQFVELKFNGHKNLEKLRLRADEAMSFCLLNKTRFFSQRGFMARCRNVDSEMESLEKGLRTKPEIGTRTTRYMM